ncbi:MobH family relaxase [Methylomonas sp. BW4-1]|uniref:MobH family relaxase n=1 Tax=Methylomonas sp. BW4-1 TaxID=3376685 RepID=UPI0040425809
MENPYSTFISRIGKRLFGDKPAPVGEVLPAINEEIPRYPPFMKGLPAAPVERILSTQTELIKAIEQALALPDDLYQNIAAPVIARYAAFSHLLPASESHHHRGAGGLFRHGLEVAHWATLASQGCLFATHASPRERKAQELRWRLAVCFAGLLHDIGKPVSDMAVVDSQGQHTWNPCDENLTDWAEQHHIDRYFLRWRENRHKRHEQFSALVIERVLTRESRSFILEPGPDIMQAMLEAIHGLDRGSKLYELVMTADCKSVERDLKAHYHSIDSAMGMPVEKYLFDAMRRLVKSGNWSVNEKGARLWRFKEGLHIVWRIGAQDIVITLAKDKVPGIPRDEDTLADILIERGLAIPKLLPDGRQYRYWRMQPEGLENPLYMLRLTSTESIFSNEPPVVVAAIEMGEQAETDQEPIARTSAKLPKSSPDKTMVVQVKAEEEKPKATVTKGSEQRIDSPDTVAEIPPIQSEPSPEVPRLEENRESENVKSRKDDQPVLKSTDESSSNKTSEASNHQFQSDQANQPATQRANIESPEDVAKSWLNKQGLAGEWLLRIVSELNLGAWQWGIDLLETQDKYLLPFPGIPEKLAVDANFFIKTLEEVGWLVTDVLSPMRKVQTIQQVRGVLLAAEPSSVIKQLLTVTESSTNVGQSSSRSTATTDKSNAKNASTWNDGCGKTSNKKSKAANHPSSRKTELVSKPISKDSDQIESAQNSNKTSSIFETCTQPETEQQPASDKKPEVNTTQAELTIAPSIDLLIEHVRQLQKPPEEKSAEGNWYAISNTELEQFLAQNPGIKRTRFMLDIANHPACRSIGAGKGIQVRIQS